jgi:hypothetical protein
VLIFIGVIFKSTPPVIFVGRERTLHLMISVLRILRSDRKADIAGLLKPPTGDILLLAYKEEAANCGGLTWFPRSQ